LPPAVRQSLLLAVIHRRTVVYPGEKDRG
jgi:hypothetical protein